MQLQDGKVINDGTISRVKEMSGQQASLDDFINPKCPVCGRRMRSPKALKQHMYYHDIKQATKVAEWIKSNGIAEAKHVLKMGPDKGSEYVLEKYMDRDVAEYIRRKFNRYEEMVNIILENKLLPEPDKTPTLYIS